MHEKPLEVLARELHYEPLPAEVRAVVVAACVRGGLLPKVVIEKIAPIATESTAGSRQSA
jgi:hypothetical protein